MLNFNGDDIHEDNPDDVARSISNKVVFYSKNLDITGFILRRFDGSQQPQAVPNADNRGLMNNYANPQR